MMNIVAVYCSDSKQMLHNTMVPFCFTVSAVTVTVFWKKNDFFYLCLTLRDIYFYIIISKNNKKKKTYMM